MNATRLHCFISDGLEYLSRLCRHCVGDGRKLSHCDGPLGVQRSLQLLSYLGVAIHKDEKAKESPGSASEDRCTCSLGSADETGNGQFRSLPDHGNQPWFWHPVAARPHRRSEVRRHQEVRFHLAVEADGYLRPVPLGVGTDHHRGLLHTGRSICSIPRKLERRSAGTLMSPSGIYRPRTV